MRKITYYNREKKTLEDELVYGEGAMRFFYENAAARFALDKLFTSKWVSHAYGAYKSTRRSARVLPQFIADFKIPMNEYEEQKYGSFNDFFIRKFRSGARSFTSVPGEMPAFCEARYVGWNKTSDAQTFPVKGAHLRAVDLLADKEKAGLFEGGPAMIARLCPVDYHRYHYPDNGITVEAYPVTGKLHSVNPVALKAKSDIFITNERRVAILKTENFGYLAYIEVGAIMVGRIVQTHNELDPFKRGDEKGYFLFGGSTVVLLGEHGKWKIDQDIIEQTSAGRECLVKLGSRIASVL